MTTHDALSGAPANVHTHLQTQSAGTALTVTEVALAIGLGRSTVGKALTALEERGLVGRQPGSTTSGRRSPDRWTASGTVEIKPGAAAEAGSARVQQTLVPDVRTGIGVAAEPEPPVTCPDGRAATDTDKAQNPARPRASYGPPKRRAPGQLRERVLQFLQERPGEEWGPTGLSRQLEASSGAISNALDRLVQLGLARQTSEKPRRFTAISELEPDPAGVNE
ncbi:helix-turn-helix domain-containing protein [Streptomyces boninensis]|uniref:helix-turn-helix domain-containing protein n=1 Tax=Streptomyces boninensis TaxID=2039455 RepID=UPI003B22016C